MENYKKITQCRICKNPNLELILDLGEQMLTGVFPKKKDGTITRGPLRLVKCIGENTCGLLQLEHSFDLSEMYGENYGYRSGLNASMVAHLQSKVAWIYYHMHPSAGDLIIDIGSNDGTTLKAYPSDLLLIGVDPTGRIEDYPSNIQLIKNFFSVDLFLSKKAKVITSFSMFYDLENPIAFMQQIYDVLADNGIWIFEQSYLPAMIKTGSFDTVCHEHLEFYTLKQVDWMCRKVGFKIIDVEFNDVNGGSFSVTVSKTGTEDPSLREILEEERRAGFDTLEPFRVFAKRIAKSKQDLLEFITGVRVAGKTIMALGASTKGNVLLQYYGLTEEDISFIGEVNPDKFGSFTPGTWIPIIPEEKVLAMSPDYIIVLPWHFKKFFEENPKYKNCNLVFPLPELTIRMAQ